MSKNERRDRKIPTLALRRLPTSPGAPTLSPSSSLRPDRLLRVPLLHRPPTRLPHPAAARGDRPSPPARPSLASPAGPATAAAPTAFKWSCCWEATRTRRESAGSPWRICPCGVSPLLGGDEVLLKFLRAGYFSVAQAHAMEFLSKAPSTLLTYIIFIYISSSFLREPHTDRVTDLSCYRGSARKIFEESRGRVAEILLTRISLLLR
ncbi:hypothetical protein Taro_054110 [Colocasia esculenta]|uniref:Uncharacterized protein n=1 Tax=Colocasia esculenta TaxID=4460 RepID=A0A843XPQ8_COLES|nr:hypothetical protein [Colocasia esculenta]